MTRAKFTPTWKVYDINEWDRMCGVSDDLLRHSGPPFTWNKYHVCTNPRVYGIGCARENWRIAVFTAQRPDGKWTVGDDVAFSVTGHSALPVLHDRVYYEAEILAITATLEKILSMVRNDLEHHGADSSVPCEGPLRHAIKLVEDEVARRTAPKRPTYTQLTLF